MGKEEKEDSGFGFKDKAKAVETLRLLEAHEPNYRRLTVRGLLGRAKRVLSMTKAEDKIKNIKEAMEVFEGWLADIDKDKEKKPDKKPEKKTNKQPSKKEGHGDKDSSESVSDEDMEEKPKKKDLPADTVPGLGFKDKEAAESTLKELEGRDPDYQKLAVKGLLGRAKRVLTCTRDETKLANIKEAMAIFDKFLEEFEAQELWKQNNPYLDLATVRAAARLAAPTDDQRDFLAAYEAAGGEHKRLRTLRPAPAARSWDVLRNAALRPLKDQAAGAPLFDARERPSAQHVQLLLWAYSPEPARARRAMAAAGESAAEPAGPAADGAPPAKRSKQ